MKRWLVIELVLLLSIITVGCTSKSLPFTETVTVDYGNWSDIGTIEDGKLLELTIQRMLLRW